MKQIPSKELTPGGLYMVTATTGNCKGLVGQVAKVIAVDGDYCVLTFPGFLGGGPLDLPPRRVHFRGAFA